MTTAIWQPAEAGLADTGLMRFAAVFASRIGQSIADGAALGAAALAAPEAFWDTLWDHFGVIGDKGPAPHLVGDTMIGTRFFPQGRLNLAENLLRLGSPRDPSAPALIFRCEDRAQLSWSWAELADQVARLAAALARAGVGPGDRVAAILPNRPEAVAAMLATAALGAVWCSTSPDFGERAILDRFRQIEPRVLLATDGYWYAGKRFSSGEKLPGIVTALPSLQAVVVVDTLGEAAARAATLPGAVTYAEFTAPEPGALTFHPTGFNDPAFILFSSGTTGAPKCIVHRAGGVLLQHLKEHALHADVRPGDRLFYFTTLGWMMWNWLVSGLARGATLLLYDGSPFHPGPAVLFDYASETGMTHFGTSAKYIDSLRKVGFRPDATQDLTALRAMLSTGSPLMAENFDYVLGSLKPDLHLASMSGGTDILSCFVLGDPTSPVHRGEIQGAGLGLAVDVWTEEGRPAGPGEKGELVCTAPFPSMPLGFWGDATGAAYRRSYFDRFPGIWCQGDFAEKTASGGFIIHGRSDTTLNPGGVRIGTAEIYAEVARFAEIEEAVVVGQNFGDDIRILLFVMLRAGVALSDDLVAAVKRAIRSGSSPRHVPALILAVADIPRTKSGKVSEVAVRDMVNGGTTRTCDSLANPDSLACFRDLPQLA